MSPDPAERLVAGRWTLQTPLRRGPAGVIWRATELAGGRSLSVEELRLPARPDPGEAGQSALWDRVAAEARAVAALDHPGLVRLDDVVVEDGVVYVASELVDALTLDELLARHGPLPVRRVAQLGLQLLDALEAVHAAGLAHLHLQPGCVLITPDGDPRLTGAGLATLRNLPRADASTLDDVPGVEGSTARGALRVERGIGSFLAPEQVRGDPSGPPADLWSLGTTLYLAVEGAAPFLADGSDATVTAILHDRPRPPELAGPLAPTLTALLTKPANGRPGIAETRHLLAPLTGSGSSPIPVAPAPALSAPSALDPGAPHPSGPGPGPPEGDRSPWADRGQAGVHSPPNPRPSPPDLPHSPPDPRPSPPDPPPSPPGPRHGRPSQFRGTPNRLQAIANRVQWPWVAGNPMDPMVRRVLLIAGGSVLLALASFAVAVAMSGDPLGLRSQAVASTVATVPSTTLPPTTTAVPTTIAPAIQAPVVPPGWAVHTDPATGYQVAVPPGWEVVSDGGPRTELRDHSSPTLLRIDWLQDPQADPVTVEQQASQAHAGERGGYSPARLEPVQFKGLPAALLEFTYQDGETWHALELGVRTPRHHVAMAIYARDRDWGAGWALFEAFKASFVPPPT